MSARKLINFPLTNNLDLQIDNRSSYKNESFGAGATQFLPLKALKWKVWCCSTSVVVVEVVLQTIFFLKRVSVRRVLLFSLNVSGLVKRSLMTEWKLKKIKNAFCVKHRATIYVQIAKVYIFVVQSTWNYIKSLY